MSRTVEAVGDIFASTCEALVNPVDCTGAQGKGLALEFRRRYPFPCAEYKRHCGGGRMAPGWLWSFSGHASSVPRWIIFAATKAHWSAPSELAWVSDALENLVAHIGVHPIRSIAIPAIGCGLGGLPWSEVRPLILAAAERMSCDRVVVFAPKGIA